MRIDDLNRTPVTQGAEQSEQTAQQRAPGKESAAASDQAEVSQLAQSLAAPDPSRIEQLRLQVQSGGYDVSAQAVANSLIDAHISSSMLT
jgi:anti-sigma28 factor (negative regulator of flagellin synthesis)